MGHCIKKIIVYFLYFWICLKIFVIKIKMNVFCGSVKKDQSKNLKFWILALTPYKGDILHKTHPSSSMFLYL